MTNEQQADFHRYATPPMPLSGTVSRPEGDGSDVRTEANLPVVNYPIHPQMSTAAYGLEEHYIGYQMPGTGYRSHQDIVPTQLSVTPYLPEQNHDMPVHAFAATYGSESQYHIPAQMPAGSHEVEIPELPETTSTGTSKRKRKRASEPTLCTYPGCKRTKPFDNPWCYRRHMREIHGVVIETNYPKRKNTGQVATDVAPRPANADGYDMQAYLEGPGYRLPTDVSQRRREVAAPQNNSHSPDDFQGLKNENEGLRQQLRRWQDELRVERAIFEAELQEAEKKHGVELDEAFQSYQEQLRLIGSQDRVLADELKSLRLELRERHGREMEKVRDRHARNERRLWNLLTGV